MKYDKITRELLFFLDSDSRATIASLSKSLRLPETTLGYRIRSLEESGIIQRAYPVFNPGPVGMSVHKLMLKLHKIDEEEIHRLCRFLAAHPIVNWVARFDGHFDVGCTVLAKHVGEVSIFLDIIRRNFHARIREISYAVNLKAEFFPRDYLISDQRRRNNGASYVSFNESKAVLELDATDWTILQELTNNARTTNVQIASRVNISAETVARRIARLEMAGLIGGYRLALDHRALARTNYYLLLHLNVVSNERIERLLAFLRSDARTVYLIKMLGEWDYDVCLEFEDAEAYRAFFINLMKQFAEVIRDVQTHTTWQVIKFSILPAAIFNGTK